MKKGKKQRGKKVKDLVMINENRREQNWIIIISLGILALLATGMILSFAKSVLIPFVLAIFIYLLISPLLDFQILKLKMPRGLAIVSTMLIVMIILALLFFVINQAAQMIISTVSNYSDSFSGLIKRIPPDITVMGKTYDTGIAKLPGLVKSELTKIVPDALGIIKSLASNIVFVTIFLIFLIAGRNPNKVRKGVYGEIDSKVRRYIAIKTVLSLITAVAVWLVLRLFGLPLAIVFAMFAFN